jgi:hypothetical protein
MREGFFYSEEAASHIPRSIAKLTIHSYSKNGRSESIHFSVKDIHG